MDNLAARAERGIDNNLIDEIELQRRDDPLVMALCRELRSERRSDPSFHANLFDEED